MIQLKEKDFELIDCIFLYNSSISNDGSVRETIGDHLALHGLIVGDHILQRKRGHRGDIMSGDSLRGIHHSGGSDHLRSAS